MILRKKFYYFPIFTAITFALSFTWFFETDIALGAICPPGAINCGTSSEGIPDPGGIINNNGVLQNTTNSNTIINNSSQNSSPSESSSGDYQLLAPLPGIQESIRGDAGFANYAQAMITLVIGFSAVLAVLMFMIGGFTYMTGDSIGSKSEGKSIMTNAIFGFVLLLASYIILETINPKLLKLDLDIQPVQNIPDADSTETLDRLREEGGGTQTSGTMRNEMATRLFGDGITVNKGDCVSLTDTNCTSLRGIKSSTVYGVNLLKAGCGRSYGGEGRCIFTITGGTEIGVHSTTGDHPKGEAIDISKAGVMNRYIRDKVSNITPVQTDKGPMYSFRIGGYNYKVIDEGNHWHIGVK